MSFPRRGQAGGRETLRCHAHQQVVVDDGEARLMRPRGFGEILVFVPAREGVHCHPVLWGEAVGAHGELDEGKRQDATRSNAGAGVEFFGVGGIGAGVEGVVDVGWSESFVGGVRAEVVGGAVEAEEVVGELDVEVREEGEELGTVLGVGEG